MLSNRSEYLICVNAEDEVIKISNTEGQHFIAVPPRMQSLFKDFCLIQPLTEYVAVLSRDNLIIYELDSGIYVSTTHISLY